MEPAVHRIQRQILEIEVASVSEGREVHRVLSRLQRMALDPVIDAVCSEVVPGPEVHRVDRLEIDLGTLERGDLERELVERLRQRLREALVAALRRRNPSVEPHRIGSHRARAEDRHPQEPTDPPEVLAVRWSEPQPGDGAPEARGLPRTPPAGRDEGPVDATRALEILSAVTQHGLLPWWATPDLRADAGARRSPLAEAVAVLLARAPERLASALLALAREPDVRARLALGLDDATLCRMVGLLAPAAADLRADSWPDWSSLRAIVAGAGVSEAPLRRTVWEAALGAVVAGADPVARVDRAVRSLAARTPAEPDASGAHPEPPAGLRRPHRAGARPAEKIYLDNAGVVLLWPFLRRFFEQLDLVREGAFVHAAASHRGAGLLWVLSTGLTEPLEVQVPLNKVLCGLAPAEVFDFGPPLQDEESSEIDGLLEAVLDHLQGLGALSIDGFRGSFLVRAGVLTRRDGAWLLRVEGRPHDVLLGRIPWSWSWIRLPWMSDALRVEW